MAAADLVGTATLVDVALRGDPAAPLVGSWTRADLAAAVERQEALLAAAPGSGEPVGLLAGNGPAWVAALLALLRRGAVPVLLAEDAPPAEARRTLQAAGGARLLAGDGWDGAPLALSSGGEGPRPRPGDDVPWGSILLPSSGSTGAPVLVARSQCSLVAEGQRYAGDAITLCGWDTVVLPLPLTHAYALGWLGACLAVGAHVLPVRPTALAAVQREMERSSIVALVPAIARLLALRARRAPARSTALRLAMVGAGPVDARLDRDFRAAFGVGLARNYGSSQTGVLCAGPAGLPSRCVGAPLPGVDLHLVDESGATTPCGGVGSVLARVDGGQPIDLGDLATLGPDGALTLLGRRTRAVRRGGRWVAPLEVEEALLRAHDVVEALVRGEPGEHADGDRLVAEVVTASSRPDLAGLRRHLEADLAPHKLPDEIRVLDEIPAGVTEKSRSPIRYVRGEAGPLVEAMRAHRRSELLFALASTGLLALLERPRSSAELSAALGLDTEAVERVLRIAASLGIVQEGGDGDPGTGGADLDAHLALEAELSRTLLTRESVAAVLRGGLGHRAAPADPSTVERYLDAMEGRHTTARTAIGCRLLPAGGRVLEVTVGRGRYTEALARPGGGAAALIRTGPLAGEVAPAAARFERSADQAGEGFDACVVANAVHGPWPGDDLAWLAARLRPGGRLLVDDVFLPEAGRSGTELGLDWLTHGGVRWWTLGALRRGLGAAGLSVVREVTAGTPPFTLVLCERS